jgi:hypothetical protein
MSSVTPPRAPRTEVIDVHDVTVDVRRRDVPLARSARAPREALERDAASLVNSLPPQLSLEETARNFPHVINRLAMCWNNARDLQKAVDDLLIDDRLKREGFPLKVLVELTEVRDWRVAMLNAYKP